MYNQKSVKGSAALSFELTHPQKGIEIHKIRLHLSKEGGAGHFKCWVDSFLGPEFDVLYYKEPLKFVTDLIYTSAMEEPILLSGRDVLKIEWENPYGITYGLEVLFK